MAITDMIHTGNHRQTDRSTDQQNDQRTGRRGYSEATLPIMSLCEW